jgi:hypothetical protein
MIRTVLEPIFWILLTLAGACLVLYGLEQISRFLDRHR